MCLSCLVVLQAPLDFKQNVEPLQLKKRELIIIPITNEQHWSVLNVLAVVWLN